MHFGVFGAAYRHPARMAGAPFPYCQFFQIYGNKLKLHPVCHLGQASVLRVTHAVHRKVTFFDRLQVISYILDKLYFYFAAIGLGGQREWFGYGFCVELAGGVWDM